MKTNQRPCSDRKRSLTILSAIVLSASLAAGTFAQTYEVTPLGILPGHEESTPTAINNDGQVIGISADASSHLSAFRYDPAKKIPLAELGRMALQASNRAFGINSDGVVVGDSSFGSGDSTRRAALFIKGVAADLGTLKEVGSFSRANGINSAGQVVGSVAPTLDAFLTRAFVWTADSGMIDIGTLGGPYAQAAAINDAGFVTGHSSAIDKAGNTISRAFLYQPLTGTDRAIREMLDLGTLGGSSSYGTAINADNHVVGCSTISDRSGFMHAFLFDGKMRDLGSLGQRGTKSDQSFALGVNKADQVVGYTFLSRGGNDQVAFLYANGVMTDLNTLIGGQAKRYLLYSATAINDKGQIAVSAFDRKSNAFCALLLKPANPRATR